MPKNVAANFGELSVRRATLRDSYGRSYPPTARIADLLIRKYYVTRITQTVRVRSPRETSDVTAEQIQ